MQDNIYIAKLRELVDYSIYDALVGMLCAFIFGVLANRFLSKVSSSSNQDDSNINENNECEADIDNLEDQDIKMVFITKVEGKSTKLAKNVSDASVELYKLNLLKGNEYNHKVLNIWDTFGSKKIVLKVKEEAEIQEIITKLDSTDIPYYKHPTYPLIAVGPEVSEKINKFTGHLKLLN